MCFNEVLGFEWFSPVLENQQFFLAVLSEFSASHSI